MFGIGSNPRVCILPQAAQQALANFLRYWPALSQTSLCRQEKSEYHLKRSEIPLDVSDYHLEISEIHMTNLNII